MTIVLFSFIMFLSLIQWIVFIDVILSWGALIGIYFRPKFIQAIVVPLYETIKRYIPSSFGGIDFTPIIIFIIIELITKIILSIDPNIIGILPR